MVRISILLDAITAADGAERWIIGRTARIDDASVEVSIEDSGPGIPTGQEKQIFEPFFTNKEGVWAENQSRGGAIFRLRLPPAEGANAGVA